MMTPHDISRILVIRYGRLGDIVLLISALRALHRRFPSAHISALVDRRYAPVLEMCSAVDAVLPVDRIGMRDSHWWTGLRDAFRLAEGLRKARYDLVIDFHSFRETNLLTWYTRARWRLGLKRTEPSYLPFCFNLPPVLENQDLHVAERFHALLKPLGAVSDLGDILLEVPPENRRKAEGFWRGERLTRGTVLVGMNLGASTVGKMWPAASFAALAVKLVRRLEAGILVLTGPGEAHLMDPVADCLETDRYVWARALGLKDLAGAIGQCDLLVSNDSGPMHFGPALGVPTLGLFSLSSPRHYRPLGGHSRFLRRIPVAGIQVEEVYDQVTEMMALVRKWRA